MKFLIESKASVNKTENSPGNTPLYRAAEQGHAEAVRILIESNASLNHHIKNIVISPLRIATSKNQIMVMELLIGAQADVNQISDMVVTALHLAALSGHENALRILIEA